MALPEPALVLLNPCAAGGRAAALAEPVSRWLRDQAPDVACEVVDGIDAARDLISRQPSGSRVVLVGGDGTIHRMLPALVDRACTLALVPLGSGNDTARALGLTSLAWADALAHALHASASPMDLGECHFDHHCVLFASSLTAGFDSAVGERALGGPPGLRGLPRYMWATLGELAALRRWPMKITLDGTLLHDGAALFASVLNTPSYGGGMPAVPHARIDDGHLDLLVAGHFGRAGTVFMLPRLLAGRHLSHPRVRCLPFKELRVESPIAVPLAGDGDSEGSAFSWRIAVRPAALRVVRAGA